jgi:hypothetical protein
MTVATVHDRAQVPVCKPESVSQHQIIGFVKKGEDNLGPPALLLAGGCPLYDSCPLSFW